MPKVASIIIIDTLIQMVGIKIRYDRDRTSFEYEYQHMTVIRLDIDIQTPLIALKSLL